MNEYKRQLLGLGGGMHSTESSRQRSKLFVGVSLNFKLICQN